MIFGNLKLQNIDICFVKRLQYFNLMIHFHILLAPVARMVKFYGIPLLTAGGHAFDYNAPKVDNDSQFHLLVKTGISFTQLVNFTYKFFDQ